MNEPTTADVLNLAADIIEARGLCRGAPLGDDGSVCTVQAISHAALALEPTGRLRADWMFPALWEMHSLVGPSSSPKMMAAVEVADWSDVKALDAFDAANHLRKAAERWAERA